MYAHVLKDSLPPPVWCNFLYVFSAVFLVSEELSLHKPPRVNTRCTAAHIPVPLLRVRSRVAEAMANLTSGLLFVMETHTRLRRGIRNVVLASPHGRPTSKGLGYFTTGCQRRCQRDGTRDVHTAMWWHHTSDWDSLRGSRIVRSWFVPLVVSRIRTPVGPPVSKTALHGEKHMCF